jgi:hypothetical protein
MEGALAVPAMKRSKGLHIQGEKIPQGIHPTFFADKFCVIHVLCSARSTLSLQ